MLAGILFSKIVHQAINKNRNRSHCKKQLRLQTAQLHSGPGPKKKPRPRMVCNKGVENGLSNFCLRLRICTSIKLLSIEKSGKYSEISKRLTTRILDRFLGHHQSLFTLVCDIQAEPRFLKSPGQVFCQLLLVFNQQQMHLNHANKIDLDDGSGAQYSP